MKNLNDILISPKTSLLKAIEVIDKAQTQVALVVNSKNQLLGSLTDGDIRRALMNKTELSETVGSCMFKNPITAKANQSNSDILFLMKKNEIKQIPVLDQEDKVIDLKLLNEYLKPVIRRNPVVIMAGGLGSRLKELTQNTPKPMLNVGDRPLLETIVRNFVDQGYQNIWMAVNYHSDKIQNYFGNGKDFGAKINYLKEEKRLGTAGALSLLPGKQELPVIVMNADLLTSINYSEMVEAHLKSSASATMAVREFEFQIPYGVVNTQKEFEISGLDEKPIHRSLVNAGIYILSPKVIDRVPKNTYIDMTDLFGKLLIDNLKLSYYQINGYWLDIGRHEDLYQANSDFSDSFL